MKLIIAGSRDLYVSVEELHDIIGKTLGNLVITEIVWGMAPGIDSCGKEYADAFKIKDKPFPADWNKYGKPAGSRRNLQMAQYADALLLIWDGRSRGSANMRARMKGMKKPVYEIIK